MPQRVVMLILVATLGLGIGVSWRSTQAVQQVAKIERPAVEYKLSWAVPNWVYSHSKVISWEQAEMIALRAMSKPHPFLLLALLEAESEFNPFAVSKVGAVGLGQIRFEVHGEALIKAKIIAGRDDLFNMEANIDAASILLSDFLRETKGNKVKALERYVGGKDSRYVRRILSHYTRLLTLPITTAIPQEEG